MRPLPFLLPLLAVTVSAFAMTCAAQAQDMDGPPPMGANGVIGVSGRTNVFFSPSGEPFRSKFGEPYPMMTWFNRVDTDHDGKISHDEFIADATAFFVSLDVNHDNFISSPENTRYETQIAPEITRMDPRIQQPKVLRAASDDEANPTAAQGGDSGLPNGGKYLKQILGAAQYGLIDEPQPIRAADSNLDFRVSMEEWLAASEERFKVLDRNGDDYITPDELPKTPFQIALEGAKGKKDDHKGKPDKNDIKKKSWW